VRRHQDRRALVAQLVDQRPQLLANLRGLTLEGLQQRLGRWVNKPQIEALLSRRDLMVKIFDDEGNELLHAVSPPFNLRLKREKNAFCKGGLE